MLGSLADPKRQEKNPMASVVEIEGVGEAHAAKLSGAGVPTTDVLLSEGATPAGRKALADKTGISEALILTWVNHVDLARINGVAGQYAELLEAAGVDTVVELAQRNAANLTAKMSEINDARNLVNRLPSESEVTRWIAEATTLPRHVHY
jgi:predicted flap endonuclease-1-like 5' DNA nuclease